MNKLAKATIAMRDAAKELTVRVSIDVKGIWIVDIGLWIIRFGVWITGAKCEVINNENNQEAK